MADSITIPVSEHEYTTLRDLAWRTNKTVEQVAREAVMRSLQVAEMNTRTHGPTASPDR
jgi:hypothetical protein